MRSPRYACTAEQRIGKAPARVDASRRLSRYDRSLNRHMRGCEHGGRRPATGDLSHHGSRAPSEDWDCINRAFKALHPSALPDRVLAAPEVTGAATAADSPSIGSSIACKPPRGRIAMGATKSTSCARYCMTSVTRSVHAIMPMLPPPSSKPFPSPSRTSGWWKSTPSSRATTFPLPGAGAEPQGPVLGSIPGTTTPRNSAACTTARRSTRAYPEPAAGNLRADGPASVANVRNSIYVPQKAAASGPATASYGGECIHAGRAGYEYLRQIKARLSTSSRPRGIA